MPVSETTKQYINIDSAYQFYNQRLFDNKLPSCLITFQRKKCYGYFHAGQFRNKYSEDLKDEIALNPDYFFESDRKVLSTLVHEMVHLWQHHFGNPTRASYHNKEWAKKMESIGLIPSNTGRPGGKKIGQNMSDYIEENGLFAIITDELLKDRIILFETVDLTRTKTDIKRVKCIKDLTGDKMTFAFEDIKDINRNSLLYINETVCQIESINETNNQVTIKTELQEIPDFNKKIEAFVINRDNKKQDRNKIKYTCPDCALNVWGKPGLNIICGKCEEQLL